MNDSLVADPQDRECVLDPTAEPDALKAWAQQVWRAGFEELEKYIADNYDGIWPSGEEVIAGTSPAGRKIRKKLATAGMKCT